MVNQAGTRQVEETAMFPALLTPLQLIDRSRQGLAGAEADRIARLLVFRIKKWPHC